MDGIIRPLMGLLAILAGLYSILIFIRMLLSWFGHIQGGRFTYFLHRVTEPYLAWWRGKIKLGNNLPFDFSPIAALVALSILQTVCSQIANHGSITLGFILFVLLLAVWSAVSFIIGFCIVILIIRFAGYMTNCNMYSPFWQVVDMISRDLLFNINRFIFRDRIVPFITGILVSIAALAGLWIVGWLVKGILGGLLLKLPL